MKALLQDLATSKLVRVTGSFADGTQTHNSDIDFYVKPDRQDLPLGKGLRNIEKVITILKNHKVEWKSTMPGYVNTFGCWNEHLDIEIEFSDLFHKRSNKLSEVTLFGVTFKTH